MSETLTTFRRKSPKTCMRGPLNICTQQFFHNLIWTMRIWPFLQTAYVALVHPWITLCVNMIGFNWAVVLANALNGIAWQCGRDFLPDVPIRWQRMQSAHCPIRVSSYDSGICRTRSSRYPCYEFHLLQQQRSDLDRHWIKSTARKQLY